VYAAAPVPLGCPLHSRQWNALRLTAQGVPCLDVAHAMGVTVSTIRTTLHHAYRALHVHTAAQAVAACWEAGWMDPVGVPWADRRVTAAQRLYLDAFDRFLHAHRDELEQRRARNEMRHHLGSMCMERNIDIPASGAQRPSNPRLQGLFSMLEAG
jgi:DNA-binding CsgD family transcriptional regulator